jgi:hypothetical protein
MDRPKPIIPIDVLLIVAINVIATMVAYYLIALWGLVGEQLMALLRMTWYEASGQLHLAR